MTNTSRLCDTKSAAVHSSNGIHRKRRLPFGKLKGVQSLMVSHPSGEEGNLVKDDKFKFKEDLDFQSIEKISPKKLPDRKRRHRLPTKSINFEETTEDESSKDRLSQDTMRNETQGQSVPKNTRRKRRRINPNTVRRNEVNNNSVFLDNEGFLSSPKGKQRQAMSIRDVSDKEKFDFKPKICDAVKSFSSNNMPNEKPYQVRVVPRSSNNIGSTLNGMDSEAYSDEVEEKKTESMNDVERLKLNDVLICENDLVGNLNHSTAKAIAKKDETSMSSSNKSSSHLEHCRRQKQTDQQSVKDVHDEAAIFQKSPLSFERVASKTKTQLMSSQVGSCQSSYTSFGKTDMDDSYDLGKSREMMSQATSEMEDMKSISNIDRDPPSPLSVESTLVRRKRNRNPRIDNKILSKCDDELDFTLPLRSSLSATTAISEMSDDLVKGAGKSSFAVQDAGCYRFLSDDCLFHCASILSKVPSNNGDDSRAGLKECDERCTTYDAKTINDLCKLVVMLSSAKRRATLLNIGWNCDASVDQNENPMAKPASTCTKGQAGILTTLLNVLAHVPNSYFSLPTTSGSSLETIGETQNSFSQTSVEDKNICSQLSDLDDTNKSMPHIIESSQDDTLKTNVKKKRWTKRNKRRKNGEVESSPVDYNSMACEMLATLAHFISLDCARGNRHSASNDSLSALRVRTTFLRHRGSLCGIAKLLLADPIVLRILRRCHLSPKYLQSHPCDPSAMNTKSIYNDSALGLGLKYPPKCSAFLSIRDGLNQGNDMGGPLDQMRPESEKLQPSVSFNLGFVVLDALKLILCGKHDNEEEDVEEVGESSMWDDEDSIGDLGEDEIEHENYQSPLIFKNIMVRRSGSLQFISRAMVETLEAVGYMITDIALYKKSQNQADEQICKQYLLYLKERFLRLAQIIDGACCLSQENRKSLCLEINQSQKDTIKNHFLVSNLLRTIEGTSVESLSVAIDDIVLSVLRTLTSLTHENNSAATQLLEISGLGGELWSPAKDGVVIIFEHLYKLVEYQEKVRTKLSEEKRRQELEQVEKSLQHCYDSIIFCLNILTNVIDSSSSHHMRKIISNLKLNTFDKKADDSTSALSWLIRWIVSQTSPFRDVLMLSSFGDASTSEQRDLELGEDEFLITAGNGFILLACLLRDESHLSTTSITMEEPVTDDETFIRETILSEMPRNKLGEEVGFNLMINTLKAFCNFYRYSIGDLSVAVTSPVLQLISKLQLLNSNFEGSKGVHFDNPHV